MYAMYANWVVVNMYAIIFICVVIWKHDKTWKATLTDTEAGGNLSCACLQKGLRVSRRMYGLTRAKKRHSSPMRGQTLHVLPLPFKKSDKRLIYGKNVISSTQSFMATRKRLLSNIRKKKLKYNASGAVSYTRRRKCSSKLNKVIQMCKETAPR